MRIFLHETFNMASLSLSSLQPVIEAMSNTVAECRCLQDPIPGEFLLQGGGEVAYLQQHYPN